MGPVKTILFINPLSSGGKAADSREKIEFCLNDSGLDYKIQKPQRYDRHHKDSSLWCLLLFIYALYL